MKKTLKVLMMFVLAVMLIPSVKANAQDLSAVLSEAGESLDDSLKGYFYGSVDNLRQTGATTTSVTIAWDTTPGAVMYFVTVDKNTGWKTTNTSFTLSGFTKPAAGYIYVYPIGADGSVGSYDYTKVKTLPEKVTGLKKAGDFGSFANACKLNVKWNNVTTSADGWEATCYTKSGKKVQTIDEQYRVGVKFDKTNFKNIYKVVVKPYILINGDTQRLYGAEASMYAAPQPKITTKKGDLSQHSIKLRWQKVSGASKYEIYVSNSPKKGFKKVATVKGSKSSYTITKFKGSTIDVTKTKYVKIVTVSKCGGKTIKSGSSAQKSCHVTVYTYYTYY